MAEPQGPKEWHRITVMFNLGERGWSETYYMNRMGANPSMPDQLKRLLEARRLLLSGGFTGTGNPVVPIYPTIVGVRVANLNNLRQAETFYLPENQTHNAGEWYTPSADDAVSCICLDANRRYKRIVTIRCLPTYFRPASAEVNEDAAIETARMQTLWNNFRSVLANDPVQNDNASARFGIFVDDKGNNPVRHTITAIAKTGTPGRWLIRVPSATWARGQRIIIRGVRGRGVEGLSGEHEIRSVDVDTKDYTLTTTVCNPCPPIVNTFGTAAVFAPNVADIVRVNDWKWTHARLGGAFFVSRGRRRSGCC